MKKIALLVGITLCYSVYAASNEAITEPTSTSNQTNSGTNPNPSVNVNPGTNTNPDMNTNPGSNTFHNTDVNPGRDSKDSIGNGGNTKGVVTDHGGGNGPAN